MMDPEDRPESTDDDADTVDSADESCESETESGSENQAEDYSGNQAEDDPDRPSSETPDSTSESPHPETSSPISRNDDTDESEEWEDSDESSESTRSSTASEPPSTGSTPSSTESTPSSTESEFEPIESLPGPVGSSSGPDRTDRGPLERFRYDMEGPLMWIREMLSSVAVVLLIGLLIFGVSGVWPPMVAVESGSMEPNMDVGDLVFVTEPGRFAPDAANNDIGVVTHENGQEAGYESFGSYGSVVIFQPPGRTASPIIHRAMFHVEEGENWYDRADDRFHGAESCEQLRNCPAPHDGFITMGDNNPQYDQASGLAEPVKAEWVTGVARLRIPYLGYVRLLATGQAEFDDLITTSTPVDPIATTDSYGTGVVSAEETGEISEQTPTKGSIVAAPNGTDTASA